MQHDNLMGVFEIKLSDLGMKNWGVIGALITHIEDFLYCGNESFDETVHVMH